MEINVEDIINEIKEEIKLKGLNKEILSFEDIPINNNKDIEFEHFDMQSLHDAIVYLNSNYENQVYRQLYGSKLIVFIKKVIRKLINFEILPLVEYQNHFNAFVVRSLNNIEKYIIEQIGQNHNTETCNTEHIQNNKNYNKLINEISNNYSDMKRENIELIKTVTDLVNIQKKQDELIQKLLYKNEILELKVEKLELIIKI